MSTGATLRTERRKPANQQARQLGYKVHAFCCNDSGINLHDGRRKSGRAGEKMEVQYCTWEEANPVPSTPLAPLPIPSVNE